VKVVLIVAVCVGMTRDILLNWQTLVIALLSGILFFQMQKNLKQFEKNLQYPLPFSSTLWKKRVLFHYFSKQKPITYWNQVF